MSYSDFNYQQSSSIENSGGYDSTYTQGSFDTSQYDSFNQYSLEKSQQQYTNQYDYTYSDSYQQPTDANTPADFYSSTDYSLNINSYSQDGVAPTPTPAYDTSSGYHQTSAYQYSNSAEPESLISAASQSYSTPNTTFDTQATYEYSEPNSYSDPSTNQYEQGGYSYNSNLDNYSNPSFENQDYTLLTNSSFSSSQYSKSNPLTSDISSSNIDYQSHDNFGIQNTQAGDYQNARSGLGSYDKTQSGVGSYQNTQSGAYQNAQSDGFQNSTSGGGYYSPFDSSQQSFNNKQDDTYVGFSFAPSPKKEYGSFSQTGGSGFSQTGGSGFSQTGGSGFSQTGGSSFSQTSGSSFSSRSGSNSFSHSGNKNFSHSGANNFTHSGGNNFSYSGGGGGNFSQQGPRGRNNFSQRREDRGAPITARNMGNQGRMNSNQMGTSINDNTRPFSSSSWRGSARSGGGQYSQNRGFNNVKNDIPNRSSPRGGKFNTFGPRDNRGNQFHSRNQNSGSFGEKEGTRKPPLNRDKWSDIGNNKNDVSSAKTTNSDSSHHGAYHTNIVKKSAKGVNKEEIKAPFYPNQKLLNEVEEKKNEKLKQDATKGCAEPKLVEDAKKDSDMKTKEGEKEKEKTETEETKSKPTEEALKVLAPPSKVPETPEEIAREEEIQRKIRESIVVVNPENEKSLLSDDPLKEVEMSKELRELLKTLTTEHFCKLCTLRMVGPQMATMHYNGKNHLKKVRIFIQTNGRSAGYNMDTMNVDESSDKSKVEDDNSEQTEEAEVDEKKYCKICKVSFSQESQSEMHYKGKNHAKKLRSVANGSEIFECKICCVTVTAQEHLTAHLNGARHKLQIRKMEGDNAHRGGLRGRGGYRGKGTRGGMSGSDGDDSHSQGQTGFRGRGGARGRGQPWRGGYDRDGKLIINGEEDEELYNLLGLTPEKRYKFDLANFRTPSGKFYCSSCDIVMEEEPQFLLHLGNRKHQEKAYKATRSKGEKTCHKKIDREFSMFSRTH